MEEEKDPLREIGEMKPERERERHSPREKEGGIGKERGSKVLEDLEGPSSHLEKRTPKPGERGKPPARPHSNVSRVARISMYVLSQ